ncbi:thermonuclease family protein [Blastomonas fulva]|uniref:thermonuclease family protein n=1 Tax=Blastomonas fulva TaxID=1550728 RepID=UPI003F72B8F0
MDAPELAQRCGQRRQQACGKAAAAWLKALVENKRLSCVATDRDRYGRLVAVCRLNGRDVGAALVEAGWATAYRKYSLDYISAESRARAARRGVWAVGLQRAEAYRQSQRGPVPLHHPPNAGSRGTSRRPALASIIFQDHALTPTSELIRQKANAGSVLPNRRAGRAGAHHDNLSEACAVAAPAPRCVHRHPSRQFRYA